MFTVIYSFKVKPEKADKFIHYWKELTILIQKYEGSLGSRLHQHKDLHYIAYAQWPSESHWKNSGSKLPENSKEISKNMKDCCDTIETLFELDVIEDLLIK